jgi:hypothetical protein
VIDRGDAHRHNPGRGNSNHNHFFKSFPFSHGPGVPIGGLLALCLRTAQNSEPGWLKICPLPNRMRRFVQRAQETARHERAIQQETERSDQSSGRKQKQAGPMQAGQRSYPGSFPPQHLAKPGLEKDLELRPMYEAPNYEGSNKLAGMVALITGGDSGIGRAVAVLYAREGADVAITYLDEHEDAEETKRAVEAEGRRCIAMAGDVVDFEFCEAAVDQTVEAFGKLDVLVNNAAFQEHVTRFEDLSEAHFDRTIKTNLYGYFHMAKAAVRHMKPGSANCDDRLGDGHRGQQTSARLFHDEGRHSRVHPLVGGPSGRQGHPGQCHRAGPGLDAAQSGRQSGRAGGKVRQPDRDEARGSARGDCACLRIHGRAQLLELHYGRNSADYRRLHRGLAGQYEMRRAMSSAPADLSRKVKTALDESRLLMLGAQVLFGFQLNSVFQEVFPDLSATTRLLDCAGLALMVSSIGLLIAPSMQHRIVEEGEDTVRIHRTSGLFAGAALLPFGISLGLAVYIVFEHLYGVKVGMIAGVTFRTVAAFFWYFLEAILKFLKEDDVMKRTEEKPTPLPVKIDQMLTEARVIIPGAQALLGFQLIVTLHRSFEELAASSRLIHIVSLCAVALAVILLMTPAALHRITFAGEDTPRFFRIGSVFVIAAPLPLALGIAGDLYVATAKEPVKKSP